MGVARFLQEQESCVEQVQYPGLACHADHALAKRQFGDRFGTMVTFNLAGGEAAANQFIQAANGFPFCPSLGELSTTLSHPVSTSHRNLGDRDRQQLGITPGTIRLSVGIESMEFILERMTTSLSALGTG
tara:strand:- start:37 stop:426 length:390 start_codon:yes stop_codon:yes gene_type:complete